MNCIFRFIVMTLGVLLPALSPAAFPQCSDIFQTEDQLKINDILRTSTHSKITENLKLQLSTLFQTIENHYGPLTLKNSTANIQWLQYKTEALRNAKNAKTTAEQYYMLADFMAGFNDAHVSIDLPSNLVYRLPLQLMAAEGRVFANQPRAEYPKDIRIPLPGDEILLIDGLKPLEFQKTQKIWNASGNSLTNQSLFATGFLSWWEASGVHLTSMAEKKGVRLQLKSTLGEVYEIELPFEKSGLSLIGKNLNQAKSEEKNHSLSFLPRSPGLQKNRESIFSNLPRANSALEAFHNLFRAEIPKHRFASEVRSTGPSPGFMQIGSTHSFFKLPKNLVPIKIPKALTISKDKQEPFFSTESIFAGTFQRNGKSVGFLRIPTYSPEQMGATVRTLRYYIHILQKETDYLVIDQTNNPGGAVSYSDLFIRSLVGTFNESNHMRFSVKPSQSFLRMYGEARNELAQVLSENPNDAGLKELIFKIDQSFKKIYSAFENDSNLSEPISLLPWSHFFDQAVATDTLTLIKKRPKIADFLQTLGPVDLTQNQHYTKPVFMMVNEFDFSGGDATPANLQDYGRVTLIGTRTAGAGGTVESFNFRGQLEFTVHLTTSLMVRKNGVLVENYGVTPDIHLPLQRSDIADRYSTYFERVLSAIDNHQK